VTYTYAKLPVTPETYAEVREKLEASGYDVFHEHSGEEVIDMHGLALVVDRSTTQGLAVREAERESVVLTETAAALLPQDYTLEWLRNRLRDLKLPPGEFLVELGVKGHRSGASVEVKKDSLALEGGTLSGLIKVRVDVTDYLVRIRWRWQADRELAIPFTFPRSTIDMSNQREAIFVSKIRFVMTELMLGRYGLQGYR